MDNWEYWHAEFKQELPNATDEQLNKLLARLEDQISEAAMYAFQDLVNEFTFTDG